MAGGRGGRFIVRLLAALGALVVVVVVFALFSGGGEGPAPVDDAVGQPAADDVGDEGLGDELVGDEAVGDGFDPALEEESDGGSDAALDGDVVADEQAGVRLLVSTAIDAFIVSELTCAAYAASVGNPAPDLRRFQDVGVERVYDDGTVLIVEGIGTLLLVDMYGPEPTFSGVEGPQGILPSDLSFGCPPGRYLGTLPS